MGAVEVKSFQLERPIARAGRVVPIAATVINQGAVDATVTTKLIMPSHVRLVSGQADGNLQIPAGMEKRLIWEIEADGELADLLTLHIGRPGEPPASVTLSVNFLPEVKIEKLPYIPEPVPVKTSILIGAQDCPIWESEHAELWKQVIRHPERTPALGLYDQKSPEIADWETKWAVEHGISYFVYCWYRTTQGGPVTTQFSSAIHDALFKSRFVDKMKFTIMWENQNRGKAGVSDEKDLMDNLLPFWMTNYFLHPSYLKIDNKPLLFIYRPEFLVQDLGSVENVHRAFERMRQACRDRGFAGLYLLGEYRGTDPAQLKLMKSLGLDYTFAYCWPVANNPTPQRAIEAQMSFIRRTAELNILPEIVNVTQGWSGWNDEGTIWRIPPKNYQTLLTQAKQFIATLPKDQLGSKTLLLDNWNEWSEGHYLAPHREYGFGYLDAVRKVFSNAPAEHRDLIPEDIGMGPYDAGTVKR